MGYWGYYDNENDIVADMWLLLRDKCLTSSKLKSERNDDTNHTYNENNIYIYENISKLYKNLQIFIKKYLPKPKDNDVTRDSKNMIIVGLCMKVFSFYNKQNTKSKMFKKLYNIPDNFPSSIKRTAIKALKENLNNVDDNLLNWSDIKQRKKALKKQLELFA